MPRPLSREAAAAIPVGLALALVGLAVFPQVGKVPPVFRSFVAASVFLVLWAGVLYLRASDQKRSLSIEPAVRRAHYIQMFAQGSVLAYWGWFVRPVYDFGPQILAQIIFAFGVDALLQWTRRDTWRIGWGPIPVIFSINLFLWFKPEYFYFQFALVAVGFLAKELIRWEKDGRSAHIFNPSSFPLGLAALLLIVTGSTDITYGIEIAQTQYNPPHIFLVIFLASLPGQLLFGVATMTWAAVVSAFALSFGYFAITGVYFFEDAYIPIAVFLGMHLLFTDPSTSPRSESGRVVFGILYGTSVVVLAAVFGAIGVPDFYDKLLPVPLLNLSVRAIDRIASEGFLSRLDPSRLAALVPGMPGRYATAALWIVTFAGLSAAGGLGDHHPGQYLPFWVEQCEAGNRDACDHRALMEGVYCDRGSVWACNELGVTLADHLGNRGAARSTFQRACQLGSGAACENAIAVQGSGARYRRGDPPLEELPIVIRGSKAAVTERDPERLRQLACDRGWGAFCSAD